MHHHGIHTIVTAHERTLPVHPSMQQHRIREYGLRPSEKRHHRIYPVNADIHQRTVRKLRTESIGYIAVLETVVTRRILAIRSEITPHSPYLRQVFRHTGERRRMRGLHGLHKGKASFTCSAAHDINLARIRGESLLTQHMFSAFEHSHRMSEMQGIRRSDVHRIDILTRRQLLQRREMPAGPMLPCETKSIAGIPGICSGIFKTRFQNSSF